MAEAIQNTYEARAGMEQTNPQFKRGAGHPPSSEVGCRDGPGSACMCCSDAVAFIRAVREGGVSSPPAMASSDDAPETCDRKEGMASSS